MSMLYQDIQAVDGFRADTIGHLDEYSNMSEHSHYVNMSRSKPLLRRGSLEDKVTIPSASNHQVSSRRNSCPVLLEEVGLLGSRSVLFKTVSSSSSAVINVDDKQKHVQRQLPQIEEKENYEEDCDLESTVTWSRRASEGSVPTLPMATQRRHKVKPSKFIDIETFQRITDWINDVDNALEKETDRKQTIGLPSIQDGRRASEQDDTQSDSDSESDQPSSSDSL